MTVRYHEATVIKMLQLATELDNFGRDMVKTVCSVNGKEINVYVQHPVDNSFIGVGYKFMLPLKD